MRVYHRPLVRLVACTIAASWSLATLPTSTAIAATDSRDDFRRCTSNLIRLKLSPEEAVSACSRNLAPQNLWECTVRISRRGYTPDDALNACRQVRRPEELANCVLDIRRDVTKAIASDVLESCRRSLLPARYSDCVIGMTRGNTELDTAIALSSCNDELFFPREIDPTFIPYAEGQPILQAPDTQLTPPTIAPQPTPTPTPKPQAPVRGLY